jgi:hypothetical protein
MKSKIATASKRDLLVQVRRLTPEQRLEAFLVHSRLVTELYHAGQRHRFETSAPRR